MASLTDFNTREGRNNDFKLGQYKLSNWKTNRKGKGKKKKSKSPKPWNNIRALRYL